MVREKRPGPSRLTNEQREKISWTDNFSGPSAKDSAKESLSIIDDSSLEVGENKSHEAKCDSRAAKEEIAEQEEAADEVSGLEILCPIEHRQETVERWKGKVVSSNLPGCSTYWMRSGKFYRSETLKIEMTPQSLTKQVSRSIVGHFASFCIAHEARFRGKISSLRDYVIKCGQKFVYLVVREDHCAWIAFAKVPGDKSKQKKHHWIKCDFPLSFECASALRCMLGTFILVLESEEDQKLEIGIKIRESAIVSNPVTEIPKKNVRDSVQVVMAEFYGRKWKSLPPVGLLGYKENMAKFYQALKNQRRFGIPEVSKRLQHPALIPRLRNYQQKAVRWMLNRERRSPETTTLDGLFQEVTLTDGQKLFYYPDGGMLVRNRPGETLKSPPGGILADEMGLGKTVEILALILHNPRPTELTEGSLLEEYNSDTPEGQEDTAKVAKDVLEEVVSTVCAQIEHIYAIRHSPKKPTRSDLFRQKEREIGLMKRKLYNNSLTRYIPPPPKRSRTEPAGTLECFCGWQDDDIHKSDDLPRIQCGLCGNWQHKECVNWKWEDSNDYLCPHCYVKRDEPIAIGATLIVSPSSICHQWYEEIRKHVRKCSLNVFIYEGVKKQGFVQPRKLGEQDIVICTYETFRSEVFYLELKHNDQLRHAKRFTTPPTPLISVLWWRICLDEAQMVEGVSTAAANLCLRLSAVNRWCVTGTPIQKSVQDLYGLILYLGLAPYWMAYWWNQLLYLPYVNGEWGPVLDLVSEIMWRTEKVEVLEQLGIPDQEQIVSWLDFSPVEEHFYRRVQNECKTKMIEGLNRLEAVNILFSVSGERAKSQRLSDLDRDTLDRLIRPLLQLRRACCHPQVILGGRIVQMKQKMMTMEEVLEKMIKDTTRECCEEHRALVAAHNGLAGVYWLRNEWPEAANEYRTVLRSCMDHSGQVTADKLQQIHALHNLAELVGERRERIPRTLRDESLKEEAEALKKKYLGETEGDIRQTKKELRESEPKTRDGIREVTMRR